MQATQTAATLQALLSGTGKGTDRPEGDGPVTGFAELVGVDTMVALGRPFPGPVPAPPQDRSRQTMIMTAFSFELEASPSLTGVNIEAGLTGEGEVKSMAELEFAPDDLADQVTPKDAAKLTDAVIAEDAPEAGLKNESEAQVNGPRNSQQETSSKSVQVVGPAQMPLPKDTVATDALVTTEPVALEPGLQGAVNRSEPANQGAFPVPIVPVSNPELGNESKPPRASDSDTGGATTPPGARTGENAQIPTQAPIRLPSVEQPAASQPKMLDTQIAFRNGIEKAIGSHALREPDGSAVAKPDTPSLAATQPLQRSDALPAGDPRIIVSSDAPAAPVPSTGQVAMSPHGSSGPIQVSATMPTAPTAPAAPPTDTSDVTAVPAQVEATRNTSVSSTAVGEQTARPAVNLNGWPVVLDESGRQLLPDGQTFRHAAGSRTATPELRIPATDSRATVPTLPQASSSAPPGPATSATSAAPLEPSETLPIQRTDETTYQVIIQATQQPTPPLGATPPVAPVIVPVALTQTVEEDRMFDLPLAELTSVSKSGDAPRVSAPAPQPAILPRAVAVQLAEVARGLPDGPVELTLNPEELGKVRMSLSAAETSIAVALTIERPETADLMRRHLDMLEVEFRALGYQDIAFSFAGGDAQQQGGEAEPTQHGLDHNDPTQNTDTATHAPVRIALGSGIDLRL